MGKMQGFEGIRIEVRQINDSETEELDDSAPIVAVSNGLSNFFYFLCFVFVLVAIFSAGYIAYTVVNK